MSAILISSDKQEDIRLLTELAERLGVRLFAFPKSEELKDENLAALFEKLTADENEVGETEEILTMLRERLAEFRKNPDDFVTLEALAEEFGHSK
ncbi:MAG TPA: hypothetical protein PK228_10260 [Saprospiraceae bacterium]|nr:hypothetical protein [Saprospiraceae bacterium]